MAKRSKAYESGHYNALTMRRYRPNKVPTALEAINQAIEVINSYARRGEVVNVLSSLGLPLSTVTKENADSDWPAKPRAMKALAQFAEGYEAGLHRRGPLM